MDDKEFKLEVLRVTLAHSTMAQMRDIISEAQKHLDWCLQPLEKAEAPKEATQVRGRKSGQAKAPVGKAVTFT
jgi:hypothetical protein